MRFPKAHSMIWELVLVEKEVQNRYYLTFIVSCDWVVFGRKYGIYRLIGA